MAWFRDEDIAVRRRHEIPLTDIWGDRAQEVAINPETPFGGLSLMYVRTLLGQRPIASSARNMMMEFRARLQREPVIGMVCFWWGGPSDNHGDIGLVISPLRALTVGYDGKPYFKQIARDDYEGSMWWPGMERGNAE